LSIVGRMQSEIAQVTWFIPRSGPRDSRIIEETRRALLVPMLADRREIHAIAMPHQVGVTIQYL
jgi:hypothetical protein